MSEERDLWNPYPGLRPFDAEETYLFFGRDAQSDELLRRLGQNRFLAVVGPSGSGKSSLVRAGLLPALQGGFMVGAGSRWRIAVMRPGADPIGKLAESLHHPDFQIVDGGEGDDLPMQVGMTGATLQRSDLGLVEAAPHVGLHPGENLLVVVDQFEELFRFKESRLAEDAHDQAAAFVKLLLRATDQTEVPIYVVLTMRSDFLGDCSQFRDLPEAINDGQYLIPRMTRSEHQEAITGPARVSGVEIAPRLVQRLLNDLGDDPDELPIMQHALMRTWDRWFEDGPLEGMIDNVHYEAIGTMAAALSRHAGEAFDELAEGVDDATGARRQLLAERLFRTITTRGEGAREVRRPTRLKEICTIAAAEQDEMIPVIEVFRAEGRTFLMPPPQRVLTGGSVIDVSHESLIRQWDRLKGWARKEAEDRRLYLRLAEAATRQAEGRGALLTDPDLQLALDWVEAAEPTDGWTASCIRAGDAAEDSVGEGEKAPAAGAHVTMGRITQAAKQHRTLLFLEQSRAARDAAIAAREEREARRMRRARATAVWAISTAVVVTGLGLFAAYQWKANRDLRQKLDIDVAMVYDEKAALALAEGDPAKAWLYTLSALSQDVDPDTLRSSLGRLLRPEVWPRPDWRDRITPLEGLVHGVAFDPDGELLAGTEDSLFSVATGRPVFFFNREHPLAEPRTAMVDCRNEAGELDCRASHLALSRGGSSWAWWDKPNALWVKSDSVIAQLAGPVEISALALSADGRWLATSEPGDVGIQVWDLGAPGDSVPRRPVGLGEAQAVALAFSPDNRFLAWAQDREIETGAPGSRGDSLPAASVWDLEVETRGASLLLSGAEQVSSLAWSESGLLAVGLESGHMTLWDARNVRDAMRPLARVEAGGGPILSLAFNADGSALAVGREGEVRHLDLVQAAFGDSAWAWDLRHVLFDARGARDRFIALKGVSEDRLEYELDENLDWIPVGDVAAPRQMWYGVGIDDWAWSEGTARREFSQGNRHIRYDLVSLNSAGDVVQVPPGERVEIEIDWRLAVDAARADGRGIYCPGCIFQFYFGSPRVRARVSPEGEILQQPWPGFSHCVDNRVMGPGDEASGRATFVFHAPSTRGDYYITHRWTTGFHCQSSPEAHRDSSNAIAVVLVR